MHSDSVSLWQSLVYLWHVHCEIASDPRGAFALLVGAVFGIGQAVGVIWGMVALARHLARYPWYWW